MRKLLHSDLISAGSCNRDADAFLSLYGEGDEVTLERTMAGAQTFDWMRASRLLLTERQRRYYNSLVLAAFRGVKRVQDPRKEYRKKAMAKAFFLAYNSAAE